MYNVSIITMSDKASVGDRVDLSGKEIERIVLENNFNVLSYDVISDDKAEIIETLNKYVNKTDLILTTGGTGFSPRDNTPEATLEVIEKRCDGISNAILNYSMTITKRAMLSRAVSGIKGKTLIVNLPGSPKAVNESLEYIIDTLIHGLDILTSNASECAR